MPVNETRVDRTEDGKGKVVDERRYTVDVTEDVVRLGMHDKIRAALAANRTFLANTSPTAAQVAAQTKALTRQHQAIFRLLLSVDGSDDLLRDETTDV